MRPRPILFLSLVLVLVLTVRFAVRATAVAGRLDVKHHELVRELEEAKARRRMESIDQSRVNGANDTPRLPGELDRAVTPPPAADSGGGGELAAAENEEIVARRREMQEYRTHLDETWGLMILRLKLTAPQAEAFRNLIARRKENDLLLEAKARREGISEDDPSIVALDDAFLVPYRAELKTLLGVEGLAAYRACYVNRPVVPIVAEIAAAAAANDAPISLEIAWALMGSLGDASTRKPSGTAIEGTVDWSKARAMARPLLSASQFAVFEMIGTRLEAEQQISAHLDRLRHN